MAQRQCPGDGGVITVQTNQLANGVHWGVFSLLEAAPIIKYIQFYLTQNEDSPQFSKDENNNKQFPIMTCFKKFANKF